VFQPSKEILTQNLAKYMSYGYRAGVYSASAGAKFLDRVTFVTIGSVAAKKHLFRHIKYIIIDECHLVNPKGGQYEEFIKALPEARVLGLTATPYRLTSSKMGGAELKFITRTRPRIFDRVLYYVQNKQLFDSGSLAKLEYFVFNVVDRNKIGTNSSGTDFSEASLRDYYRQINMPATTIKYGNRLLAKRKNLLVFCSLLDEARTVTKGIPGAVMLSGDTPGAERDKILANFISGKIKCVVNVGVLTTGFDFPELECILIARSTMSLALYYQIIGRVMRPHPNKESGWVVDLGGNFHLFGKIETMEIRTDEKGKMAIWQGNKQLTNTPFQKAA
jgi:DNA repair protein RadD